MSEWRCHHKVLKAGGGGGAAGGQEEEEEEEGEWGEVTYGAGLLNCALL